MVESGNDSISMFHWGSFLDHDVLRFLVTEPIGGLHAHNKGVYLTVWRSYKDATPRPTRPPGGAERTLVLQRLCQHLPEVNFHGILAAGLAYVAWGLLPIYWRGLHTVPALEILSHRVVWSLVVVGFSHIWTALLIYTIEGYVSRRRRVQALAGG